MTLSDDIKRVLELDGKRTQGKWICGGHPARSDLAIINPIMFGNRVGKLPECEGGDLECCDEGDDGEDWLKDMVIGAEIMALNGESLHSKKEG